MSTKLFINTVYAHVSEKRRNFFKCEENNWQKIKLQKNPVFFTLNWHNYSAKRITIMNRAQQDNQLRYETKHCGRASKQHAWNKPLKLLNLMYLNDGRCASKKTSLIAWGCILMPRYWFNGTNLSNTRGTLTCRVGNKHWGACSLHLLSSWAALPVFHSQ